MKKLSDLDPAEISLVSKGANKRKFLIWKSEDGLQPQPNTQPVQQPMPQPLSDRARAAVQAVVRILTPFKGEIKDADLDKALADSGVIPMEDQPMPAAIPAGAPAPAPQAAPAPAKKMGKDEVHDPEAYPEVKTNSEKEDPDMDAQDDLEDEEDGEDGEDGMMEKMKACKSDDELLKVAKGYIKKGAPVKKSVTKADGSIDMTAVPEEVRPAVEAIYKSQQELVKKNESLSKELGEERKARREKEYVAKAAEFKHYTGDRKELAVKLEKLEAADKDLYESFCKQLASLDAEKEAVHKSLTSEIGSSVAAPGSAEDKIDAAVKGIVQKSADGTTYAKAYEKFLQTPEGQALYTEFKSSRKGGI